VYSINDQKEIMMLSEENQKLLLQLQELHNKGQLTGQFTNIPDEVYHHPDCPGVSNSNLTTISKSYDHYLASLEEARKERSENDFKDKFFLGRAYHMLTLEPDRFYSMFSVCPTEPKVDKRTKVGKETYLEWEKTILDPWEKENQGKIRMPIELWEQLHAMTKATLEHPVAGPLIKASAREVTFFWRDEKTGITCKCRADAINFEYGIIIDLKSTIDAIKGKYFL
jgi:hypothetical protein